MKWLNNRDLHVNVSLDPKVVFRQIGWHGQTGEFYNMEQDPSRTEPGGFSPVYVQVLPE